MIYKITSLKKSLLMLLLFSSLLSSNEIILIDVRSLEEVKTGIIQDAIHIEWTQIDKEINDIDVNKDQPIFLYCRSGNRSGKATVILEKIGFTNVVNAGGIKEAAKKLDKKIVQYSE
tara:strand:+ start:1024 stop:1374 length:351 start_codon:yes stop_codon:yes gene_type:complete